MTRRTLSVLRQLGLAVVVLVLAPLLPSSPASAEEHQASSLRCDNGTSCLAGWIADPMSCPPPEALADHLIVPTSNDHTVQGGDLHSHSTPLVVSANDSAAANGVGSELILSGGDGTNPVGGSGGDAFLLAGSGRGVLRAGGYAGEGGSVYVAGGHSYGGGRVGGSVHLAGGGSFADHSIGGAITLTSGVGRNGTGEVAIASADAPASAAASGGSGDISIRSGTASSANSSSSSSSSDSGSIAMGTGDASHGQAGGIRLAVGSSGGAGSAGSSLVLSAGDATAVGGSVDIVSGYASGETGAVRLSTPDAEGITRSTATGPSNLGASSGNIVLKTGSASKGSAGQIAMETGPSRWANGGEQNNGVSGGGISVSVGNRPSVQVET